MDKNIPHRLLFKVVLLISQVSEFARYVTYSNLLFGSNKSSSLSYLTIANFTSTSDVRVLTSFWSKNFFREIFVHYY